MKSHGSWSGALIGLVVAVAPLAASAAETRMEIKRGEPVVNIEAGGGVFDFRDTQLNDNTKLGGGWEARATVMPAWPVSLELGYVGAMNDIDIKNNPRNFDTQLQTNSGRALLKVNPLEIVGLEQSEFFHITPYVAAGAAYTNMQLIGNDRNDPDVKEVFTKDENQFAIPAAVGVQARIQKNFTVGARAAYDYIPDNKLTKLDTNDAGQSWGATANVGMAF